MSETADLSSSDLRLLTSGLIAFRKANEKPVNKIELQALSSMIAYVADTQNVSEETVASILTAKFGASEVKTLPSTRYPQMIEYLIDVRINEILN